MAFPGPPPDLPTMYGYRRTSDSVHEPSPRYGHGADGADDRFPADEVLLDLALAEGADRDVRIARIVARYAALRHWLLRLYDAPPTLLSHAAGAARAHLSATTPGAGPAPDREDADGGAPVGSEPWPEGEMLRKLEGSPVGTAAGWLAAAALEADVAGDVAGADALRRAAGEAVLVARLERRRRSREN